MATQYKFLGKKYDNLAEVNKDVNLVIDAMLEDWRQLNEVVTMLDETYEEAKKKELERDEIFGDMGVENSNDPTNTFVTRLYDSLLTMVRKRQFKEKTKQDNIILNDRYDLLLKDIGISVKRHQKAFKSLTKTVAKVADCDFTPCEMACAIKPEKEYVGFIIETFERQKEYNNQHYFENSGESENNI